MTSANDKKTDANIKDSQTDNQGAEKQNSLLSSIIERATKSGLGRKKLNPSAVESAVAKTWQKSITIQPSCVWHF